MARGVTQDQVNQAADALLQRGERPTIEKVRAELGTGSPNTLIKLIESWWQSLAERLAAQARANLPDIPASVQQAMMTLWSEAVISTRSTAEQALLERERVAAESSAEAIRRITEAQAEEQVRRQELALALSNADSLKTAFAQEQQRSAELQLSLSDAMSLLRESQVATDDLRRSSDEAQSHFRSDLGATLILVPTVAHRCFPQAIVLK
ncbi:hypothetical protein ELE36_10440 [Pseudolysobacter antarcticus]|uniref:KfrA N-terminal DNA-binding domain-containing protein n=1 Tax=Pseudolysobacter antarcticus TaxID=2511995 RepID=A0A411HJR9_9GAMM|nr:DNA-binding protein [Pseudolysobacter antarcticus]QBB70743.1 hypothetical protein ELE36_10440 [Pseudolysobacter antarcticus]